ncbi:hypothetical protein GCM10009769_04640 [Curtobacterium luteum]|uniref:UspA domain-containing protein n=1 Tax=Curtobacterium luteum TaxID=33881 RepID=A0A8H9G8K4_9MICO|nr:MULTISPECIES: universal stress protein [Curtobacterium]NUU52132.1 universal stress protein [Curtobacterium luteum]GGK89675.1 hypothetical protein GCM10009769_04640 [Curtobacterium luteum]
MTRRFVVGWDGSTAARGALAWALDRVEGGPNRLIVVHAVPADSAAPSLSTADFSVRAAVNAVIDTDHAVRVDVEVHRGHPTAVLLASVDADSVLVVGRDGVPAARGSRPSLADRLVGAAPCTVVVVPLAPGARRDGIVVAVDPGASSRPSLRFAVQEARRTRQSIVAVSAWSPRHGNGAEDPGGVERTRRLRMLEEQVEDALAEAPDVDVVRRLVAGPPARRIVESAEAASLLVIGAGHRRARAGTVTEQVVRASRTPVAVVR